MTTILNRRSRRTRAIPTRPDAPARTLGLVALVLALMVASAACAAWLTWQRLPDVQGAQLREAEDAAFSAGRVTAMAEMSDAMAQVYEQGWREALEDQARGGARAAVRGPAQ